MPVAGKKPSRRLLPIFARPFELFLETLTEGRTVGGPQPGDFNHRCRSPCLRRRAWPLRDPNRSPSSARKWSSTACRSGRPGSGRARLSRREPRRAGVLREPPPFIGSLTAVLGNWRQRGPHQLTCCHDSAARVSRSILSADALAPGHRPSWTAMGALRATPVRDRRPTTLQLPFRDASLRFVMAARRSASSWISRPCSWR